MERMLSDQYNAAAQKNQQTFLITIESTNYMITIKHEGCILCVGCSSVCPTNAIEVVGTRMEHFSDKCIDCGLCVMACPSNVIQMFKGIKEFRDLPIETNKKGRI